MHFARLHAVAVAVLVQMLGGISALGRCGRPIARATRLVPRGSFSRSAGSGVSGDSSEGPAGSFQQREVVCITEEDIEALGTKLSQISGNGDVLLLRGDLGAGKTTLARGVIRHKFGDARMRVTSPSYLLDNTYEYAEDCLVHHMDLYRLPTGCDLSMLGVPAIYSSSLCLIEWPQRLGEKLPADYLDVNFSIRPDQARSIVLTPASERWRNKLQELFP